MVGLVRDLQTAQEVRAPERVEVVLDRSPFYGEAGGQVGDEGLLESPEGRVRILDTRWVGNVLVHRGEVEEGRIRLGDPVTASVDLQRRRRVAKNHTATHLLHSALRKVLGGHVVQAGSLVAPDRLRFDFSHAQALTAGEREAVEGLVAEWVEAGLPVSTAEMSLQEAKAVGAIALFGEKYGTQVRVVSIGQVSKEFCGGTHLSASSEVGLLTLVDEGSVAAGMRRIEALTGREAFRHLRQEVNLLEETAGRLKSSPGGVGEAVEKLLKRAKDLEKEMEALKRKSVQGQKQEFWDLLQKVEPYGRFQQKIQEEIGLPGLRSLADELRRKRPDVGILLMDLVGNCVAASGEEAVKHGIFADELLRASGASGGGRKDLAQGKLKN